MNIEETKNKGLERHFNITISAKDVKDKYDKEMADIRKKGKFDGFRPGRIPIRILESKYGKSVYSEISGKTIDESISKLCKDKKINLASQPKLDIKNNQLGQDIVLSIEIEPMPEIVLPDLKTITLERPVIDVQSQDIDDHLNEIAGQHKEYQEKNGKASNGDQVIIDFNGKLDGKEFNGGKAESHPLEIGSKTMIPGFEEKIVGHKAGDKFTIKITFPKDYASKDLAGKDATFDIVVHKVNKIVKSKIDDVLAVKLGAKDLKDLRVKVKEMIIGNYTEQSYIMLKMKLFDQLEQILKFDVPKSIYDKEYKAIKEQTAQDKPLNESLKKKSEQEVENYYNKVTNRRVRIGLMLADFADKNKIKVDQQDIYEEIQRKARSMPGYEKALFDFYKKNPKALEALAGPVLENKSVAYIVDKEIARTEKKLTKDQFDKLIDKENTKAVI